MTIQSLNVDVAALQRLPETDALGLSYDEGGLGKDGCGLLITFVCCITCVVAKTCRNNTHVC
jgi:hypothetical protein